MSSLRVEKNVFSFVFNLSVACVLFASSSPGIAATSILNDADMDGRVSLGDVIEGLRVLSGVNDSSQYSQRDLVGVWYATGLITPTSGASSQQLKENFLAEAGQLVVLADGTFRMTINEDSDSGSFLIAESGEVTVSGADDVLGMYLNAGKDVLTVVFDNQLDNEQGSILFVKAADIYLSSDLTGTWYSTGMITPSDDVSDQERSTNYGVESGSMVIQENGSYIWTTDDDSDSGMLSLSAIGWISEGGADDVLGWYMNAGKDVMTVSFTNTVDHEQGQMTFVKRGSAYSQSDLTGTWYTTGIITPISSLYPENYEAEAGIMTIAADGSYQFVTNGDTDTGTLSISSDGIIQEAEADDVLGWYMNAGKDVMTLVFDSTVDQKQGQMTFVKKN